MLDERQVELIHGEVDGANSGDESAELGRVLASHPEARELLNDMQVLRTAMKGAGEVEPPRRLKPSIMNAIPAPRAGRNGTRRWFGERWGLRPEGRGFTPAAVFSFGLVAGIFVTAFVVSITRQATWHDGGLPGSLVSLEETEKALPGETVRIDHTGGTAELGVGRLGKAFVAHLSAESAGGADVEVAFDSGVLALKGLVPALSNAQETRVSEGLVRIVPSGRTRIVLLFERKTGDPAALRLRVYERGALVAEKGVDAPDTAE